MIDFVLRVTHNQTVEIFLGIVCISIRTTFAFLDAAFATDTNLSPALLFHFLETVATRADQKPEEVDLWEFFHRNVDLLLWTERPLLLVILDRWTEVRIDL